MMEQFSRSLIVVDDDAESLRTLDDALSANGFKVTAFSDPRDVLAHNDPGAFGAAIVDYRLPGMNGIDLLQELKRRNPAIAVVVVTGQLDEDIQVEAMRHGAVDFFYKPIDFLRLMNLLNRILALNGHGSV